MAPNLNISPASLGDLNQRDAYVQNKYQRGDGPVYSGEYTIVGNTAVQSVAHVSTLVTGNAGSYHIFAKPAGTETNIDTGAATPTVTVTDAETRVTSVALRATRANLYLGNVASVLASPTTLALASGTSTTLADTDGVYATFSRATISTGANVLLGNTRLQGTSDLDIRLSGPTDAVNIRSPSDATLVSLSSEGVDIRGNGSLLINNFSLSPNGHDLDLTLPITGNAGQLNIIGVGGTFSTIAETGMYVAGVLTVDSDILASADLNVAGECNLYGDVNIFGNLALESQQLLLGVGGNTFTNAGLLIGQATGNTVASFLYQDTASFGNTAAMDVSIPIVYNTGSVTSELGSGVTVSSSSNKSVHAQLAPSHLEFSDKWRLRYDSVDEKMVFEFYDGTAWTTKFAVRSV